MSVSSAYFLLFQHAKHFGGVQNNKFGGVVLGDVPNKQNNWEDVWGTFLIGKVEGATRMDLLATRGCFKSLKGSNGMKFWTVFFCFNTQKHSEESKQSGGVTLWDARIRKTIRRMSGEFIVVEGSRGLDMS